MSFTDRRRRGELEPLVSVVDDVAETADMADSLEISVPLRRPYVNNDRFRPRSPVEFLPWENRGRHGLSGSGASVSISTGCTVTDGREGTGGGELRAFFSNDKLSASKSVSVDGYLDNRLEGEVKKDLTLSTIDLLLFGRYPISTSGLSSGAASNVSSWTYGEPRAEGLSPVRLLRIDPTSEAAPDEHIEVVASGGAI